MHINYMAKYTDLGATLLYLYYEMFIQVESVKFPQVEEPLIQLMEIVTTMMETSIGVSQKIKN